MDDINERVATITEIIESLISRVFYYKRESGMYQQKYMELKKAMFVFRVETNHNGDEFGLRPLDELFVFAEVGIVCPIPLTV